MIKRGDIYYADLSPVVGSEQGGLRPVLIVQNDVGNRYSPTVIAAAITSQVNKSKLPTHIELNERYGLSKESVILLEQVRTIDKARLREKGGRMAYIHAQQRAVGFYRKIGYTAFGDTESEQGYPHTWMKKIFKP